MIDDANAINVPFEPPDADIVYEKACPRAGVTAVSRHRAQDLIAE